MSQKHWCIDCFLSFDFIYVLLIFTFVNYQEVVFNWVEFKCQTVNDGFTKTEGSSYISPVPQIVGAHSQVKGSRFPKCSLLSSPPAQLSDFSSPFHTGSGSRGDGRLTDRNSIIPGPICVPMQFGICRYVSVGFCVTVLYTLQVLGSNLFPAL